MGFEIGRYVCSCGAFFKISVDPEISPVLTLECKKRPDGGCGAVVQLKATEAIANQKKHAETVAAAKAAAVAAEKEN